MTGKLRTFSDFEAEYNSFDISALLAEAATLPDIGPFNQVLAMSARLLDLLGNAEMTVEHRAAGIRLTLVLQKALEAATSSDQSARNRLERARDARFQYLLQFATYPEYIKLTIPKGWTPSD